MSRHEIPLLPEPNVVAPQSRPRDPFVSIRFPRYFRIDIPDFERATSRVGQSLASVFADRLAQEEAAATERAELTGISKEFGEDLVRGLAGVEPGSIEEAREIDKILRARGIPGAADQLVALKARGRTAALDALRGVQGKVLGGTYDRNPAGIAPLEEDLASARGDLIGSLSGSPTVRDAAAFLFDLQSREVVNQASRRQAVTLHGDATGTYAGEFASGSADNSTRGAGALAVAPPGAVREIIGEMQEKARAAGDVGLDMEDVILGGLRSAIEAEEDPAGRRRILSAFLMNFRVPGAKSNVTRPDGTLTGSDKFQVTLASLEDENETYELQRGVRAAREDTLRRETLGRRLADVATVAAAGDNVDPKAAIRGAISAFRGTEEGARLAVGLDDSTVEALAINATTGALGGIGARTQADRYVDEALALQVMETLIRDGPEAALALAENASPLKRLDLRRDIEGTAPEIVEAMSEGIEVRDEISALSEVAARRGEADTLEALGELADRVRAIESEVLASSPSSPDEARARLRDALKPSRLQIEGARRADRETAAAGVALSDAVALVVDTDPAEARRLLEENTGAPRGVKAAILERVAQVEQYRRQGTLEAIRIAQANVNDLVEVLGPTAGFTDENITEASLAARNAVRAAIVGGTGDIVAPSRTFGGVAVGLVPGAVEEALRGVIPDLPEGRVRFTAEQFKEVQGRRSRRAAAEARTGDKKGIEGAAREAANLFRLATGPTLGAEIEPHVEALGDTLRAAISGRDKPSSVVTGVARYWLAAGSEPERRAGVSALLTSGAVPIEDIASGRVTSRVRFGDRRSAARQIRDLATGGDLDQNAIADLIGRFDGVKPGESIEAEVGGMTLTLRSELGFLGINEDVTLSLSSPVGESPGALLALRTPEAKTFRQMRAVAEDAISLGMRDQLSPSVFTFLNGRLIGVDSSRKEFREVANTVAARKALRDSPGAIRRFLGMEGATDVEVENRLLEAYTLAEQYR